MNILDLSPEDFEISLKELALGPEREQSLRDEYANKNTLSGQMMGAFESATQLPEGRERASVLPMTKPEGMSGFEAIRSGEAELALPGMLTGAAEDVGTALRTGEKVQQGLEVTQEELSQAAQAGAGLGLSGAATRIGKPFDRTVLSSGGAGPSKGYTPSLFKPAEEGVATLSPYSVAEFYSPTVETIRNAEFPIKGYKGSEVLKLLQDKTPGVRRAELNAMDLGLDPQKRYTKDELLGLAEQRSYKVTAEVVDNDPNQDKQRQKLRDQEVSYNTLKINAVPNSPDTLAFYPRKGYTHYDPETIAHTRVSVREDNTGREYMLVEEIQSDLIQAKPLSARGPITLEQAYDEVLEYVPEDILSNYIRKSEVDAARKVYNTNKDYFDNIFKISSENRRQIRLQDRGIEVPEQDKANLNRLVETTKSFGNASDIAEKANTDRNVVLNLSNAFERLGAEEGAIIQNRTRAIGKSPLTEDSDAVRLALQTAIAKANDEGVGSLVIPNLQRIVAERARPGTPEYERYVAKDSGFQKTYVSGVEKFIKQLKDQYGDTVKIETVELPYLTDKAYTEGKEIAMPNTGIKIDFSNLEGVDFRVGRFAEGGMVEDRQMKKLLAEGGMADDGVAVEPVTGNEVPPGSLANEVRDDIPAQLSEGEYIVPADVVRFFGVRFFEDLRSQAKQGLTEMDADGRIGGTPVTSQGIPVESDEEGDDEDLSDEEEQMLREALGASGMAYGGMVAQPATTPYQDQATLYTAPAGMAEGGMAAPAFDRTQFKLEPAGTAGFETREYVNPTTGEKKSIQFLNGIALGAIPEGFVLATGGTPAPTTPAPTTPTPPVSPLPTGSTGGSDRSGVQTQQVKTEGGTLEPSRWAEKNAGRLKADPYQFGVEALTDKSGQLVGKGLGALGMATGFMPAAIGGAALQAGNKIQNIAEAKAALRLMGDKGMQDSDQYKDLSSKINSSIENLPAFQEFLVNTGLVATADNYYKQLASPTTGTKTPTVTTRTASGGKSDKNITATFSTERAPTTSKTITAKKAPSTLGTTSGGGGGSGLASSSTNKTGGKAGYSSVSTYAGGRAKGGLVTKPSKKK